MSAVMAEEEQKSEIQRWRCPKCGNVIKTHVPLSQDPTCHNPDKHDRKLFVMEKMS